MTPLVLTLPGNDRLGHALVTQLGASLGEREVRRFPDGDSYVRIDTPIAGRDVVLVCTLDRPDEKLVPLWLMAQTARDLGARRVGLVAPYLAYMRQDKRFRAGEAVSSAYFGQLLSKTVDWLVTVDPHLHRHQSLNEIFSIPAIATHAAPALAAWIRQAIPAPILIGPDSESAQWVSSVAAQAEAPFLVFEKTRHGDRDVAVSAPAFGSFDNRTPVLVDDIVSTAQTMIATLHQLTAAGARAPVCVGVHAIFAGDAHRDLRAAGAATIATCNTIEHESNAIDVSSSLADAVRRVLES